MYYSNGNYEAFAKPRKPEGVDEKSAYLVGSGLASLAAACFLVRDGQMKGEKIHILEEAKLPGGACDGIKDSQKGFIIRGGREMENHFECLWDLFRSIPSLETEGASVLDEYYWLNKKDPNYSLMRATVKRGEDAHTDGKFGLSDKASMEIIKLFMTKDEDLYDKKITDVFTEEFFESNFWLYWRTMFAFEDWHSALEMKLYIQRFIHHIGGLPDFSALKFTKYNQYESLILPMVKYLEAHGVNFEYDTKVTDVVFDIDGKKKTAKQIVYIRDGKEETIDLTVNDLVFVTNGSCTESSMLGDQNTAPDLNIQNGEGACWDLWRKIARQSQDFGHPDKFCSDISKTNWESATVTTLDDKIPPYIEKICKRDPFSGRVVTGGIVSVKDSNWLMSWTINRQPHFKDQPKDQLVVWVYGLFTNFMPRTAGDRPKVVPEGCRNFAFLGQFADTVRDTVFTTEYSVRTAMEAVYTLLDVDRGVPEVFGSCYDIRVLLDSTSKMMDGKKLEDIKLPMAANIALKSGLKKVSGTIVEELLERYNLI